VGSHQLRCVSPHRSARRWWRGVSRGLAELDSRRAGERCRRRRRCRPAVQRLGPPPALRSTTAVLAAIWGQGVDRMPPQGRSIRGTPCRMRGRGMSRASERPAAPAAPGGGLGSQAIRPRAGDAPAPTVRHGSVARMGFRQNHAVVRVLIRSTTRVKRTEMPFSQAV
jgi:hypothetical protein